MPTRSIATWVLIGYSVILVLVVVFKVPFRMVAWASPERSERAAGAQPGRGRGNALSAGSAEGRSGGRRGPAAAALADTRRSTSRFAPPHANYVPFKTIGPQLRGRPRWGSAIVNLAGNTILFMPVGFLVVLVCRKMRGWESLVLAVAVGVAMEVMEGVFRVGVVDIDDVILNALGVMSGYWLGIVWARRKALARSGRPRNPVTS